VKVEDVQFILESDDCLLIDIRNASEQQHAVATAFVRMSSDQLIAQKEQLKARYNTLVVMCYSGKTSAKLCQQLGAKFESIEGGFDAWIGAGLPVSKPSLNTDFVRYQQQIKLPGFGHECQNKLADAHVLVVGAGGLGSPALLYLAGSGVGEITLIDDDEVTLDNLHRQILFNEHDIGLHKAEVANQKLTVLNSNIKVNVLCERLDEFNAERLISAVDVVIDGSDNIETRYLINDCCLRHAVPWVYAAVSAYDIQVAFFGHSEGELCYRCLFPALNDSDSENCSRAGVLGPVPGLAATIQVIETIKYITQLGTQLHQKMLTYNVLDHSFKVLKYPSYQACSHRKINYE